jgi:adenosylmethionine-8-amino-7-oxononanoate aminotransferase
MFPMAATLVSERLFDGFQGDPSRAFWYGHTYAGNPLGAAIAREVLCIYREEQILEKARLKAQKIAEAFASLEHDLARATHARFLGMLGAINLREDSPGGSGGYLGRVGWRVSEEARRLGVYLRPLGDVVYVAPPLNIGEADLDELLGKVRMAVERVVG